MSVIKTIPKFPGYAIDESGNVWSRWTKGGFISSTWKKLRIYKPKNGYHAVQLTRNKIPHYKTIHRLLLETFVGDCPLGCETRHLDGDKTNNHLSNLKWGTHLENVDDRAKHGTNPQGIKNGKCKLRDRDVKEIRVRVDKGEKHRVLSKEFGVSQSVITNIVNYKTWKHIQ